MSKAQNLFRFKPEANFFDAKAYMLKTFFAIATAYFLAKQSSLVSKDMISVLFGLMLTLEPVTLTGFKRGWEQIYATIIGAIVTALIVSLFGINAITVGVSVAVTILVCVRINWKFISPVAIFTSIYMTQYVQVNEAGDPSMINTFTLRMLALATGVAVAWFYNFIFAMLSYKRMKKKRLSYLFACTKGHLDPVCDEHLDHQKVMDSKTSMAGTFNDIDWLYGLLEDMKLDDRILRIVGIRRHENLEAFQRVVMDVREINHLTYDLLFILQKENLNEAERRHIIAINKHMDDLFNHFAMKDSPAYAQLHLPMLDTDTRNAKNINEIIRHISYIDQTISELE